MVKIHKGDLAISSKIIVANNEYDRSNILPRMKTVLLKFRFWFQLEEDDLNDFRCRKRLSGLALVY